MTVRLDVVLAGPKVEALRATEPTWWFTRFEFANATSPRHPHGERLELAHAWKRDMVLPWLERVAPRARVLDVFCANGAFSFEAARLGATEVVGVDYDAPRLECARFIGSLVEGSLPIAPSFIDGDVYELPSIVEPPFDVTVALGGLYHVADPVLVLDNLRRVTRPGGHLLLQTSRIIRVPGSWGKFITTRRVADRTADRGAGVWKLSVKALETMIGYAGFERVEVLSVPRHRGKRIPWYGAVWKAV
jgi:2-polyprenyl-3-methyl-5-hydroxy-6-metoxy-1,4-benzoquinol methylase